MELTRKERWLRSIQGKEIDRLVFWPKIFNSSYMQHQSGIFASMSIREVHDYIGSDIQEYLPNYIRYREGNCFLKEEFRDNYHIKTYTTPHGQLKNILKYDATTDSYHPEKMPIETLEDILLMTEYFSDLQPEIDFDLLHNANRFCQEFGDRGLVADNISESPFMDFVEWYAGIENAQYLLLDYPDEIEELLSKIQNVNIKLTQLKAEYSPADVLYFTENTSTTIISPTQFIDYCKPYLTEYADLCNEADRTLIYHMCGHLKFLLNDINEIPFQGIEALSSPPIGNTTFADARSVIKEKCLIGGSNCLTWVQSPNEIIKELENYFNELEHHRGIVIGTGGVIPPACSPDTLKIVNEYLKTISLRF